MQGNWTLVLKKNFVHCITSCMSHQHSKPHPNYNTQKPSPISCHPIFNSCGINLEILMKKRKTNDWFVQLYIYGKFKYICMGKLNTYVMSINVYIEILKLFYFFNQLIIFINQGAFSFEVIFHVLIWHTINVWIFKPILNNCDD